MQGESLLHFSLTILFFGGMFLSMYGCSKMLEGDTTWEDLKKQDAKVRACILDKGFDKETCEFLESSRGLVNE